MYIPGSNVRCLVASMSMYQVDYTITVNVAHVVQAFVEVAVDTKLRKLGYDRDLGAKKATFGIGSLTIRMASS